MRLKTITCRLIAFCNLALNLEVFASESCFRLAIQPAREGRDEIVQAQEVPIRFSKRAIAGRPQSDEGNLVNGIVTFEVVDGGSKKEEIVAKVDGLTPGKHGFHIHEYGDCSAPDGASAGGRFNPTHKKHGAPDALERHVGDLGNIYADEKGHGEYERVDSVVSLTGPDTIIGRSVIVHALPDDFVTQPTGECGRTRRLRLISALTISPSKV